MSKTLPGVGLVGGRAVFVRRAPADGSPTARLPRPDPARTGSRRSSGGAGGREGAISGHHLRQRRRLRRERRVVPVCPSSAGTRSVLFRPSQPRRRRHCLARCRPWRRAASQAAVGVGGPATPPGRAAQKARVAGDLRGPPRRASVAGPPRCRSRAARRAAPRRYSAGSTTRHGVFPGGRAKIAARSRHVAAACSAGPARRAALFCVMARFACRAVSPAVDGSAAPPRSPRVHRPDRQNRKLALKLRSSAGADTKGSAAGGRRGRQTTHRQTDGRQTDGQTADEARCQPGQLTVQPT